MKAKIYYSGIKSEAKGYNDKKEDLMDKAKENSRLFRIFRKKNAKELIMKTRNQKDILWT